jgi:zinc D-Ala-D-Ala carboxypeptidase
MQLTKNFSLAEMLKSNTAQVLGYDEQYKPPAKVLANMRLLANKILQPLRDFVGIEIFVSSGYRCPRVNKAVGGVASSQHQSGEAADIKAGEGFTNQQLFEAIKAADLPVDQCIVEFRNEEGEPTWIHVSYSADRQRGEYLEAYKVKGKTKYKLI